MDTLESFAELKDEKATSDEIEEFREQFDDSLILSDQFVSILCITHVRNAGQIEGYFSSRSKLEEFVNKMNEFGVKCFVDYNLEKEDSTLWTMSKLFEEANEGITKMLEGSNHVVSIYLSSNSSSSTKEVRRILKLKERGNMISYHREFGRFLNYPEEDIESFVFGQLPSWKRFLLSLFNRDVPEAVTIDDAAKKYGEDFDKRDRKILNAFSFHMVRDSSEDFERMVETAFRRFERLDEVVDAYDLVKEVYY